MYRWWESFCQSANLTITPKQALDIHKQQFFAWLDEQKRQDEAEKQRKIAEVKRQRQVAECAHFVDQLILMASDLGRRRDGVNGVTGSTA